MTYTTKIEQVMTCPKCGGGYVSNLDEYCARCGTKRPSPSPQMTEDERMALELTNLYKDVWASEPMPPARWEDFSNEGKAGLLDFLARASELLGPGFVAQGRREAFQEVLTIDQVHRLPAEAVAWITKQRDACGPAKSPDIRDDATARLVGQIATLTEEAERLRADNEAYCQHEIESKAIMLDQKQQIDRLTRELAEARNNANMHIEALADWDRWALQKVRSHGDDRPWGGEDLRVSIDGMLAKPASSPSSNPAQAESSFWFALESDGSTLRDSGGYPCHYATVADAERAAQSVGGRGAIQANDGCEMCRAHVRAKPAQAPVMTELRHLYVTRDGSCNHGRAMECAAADQAVAVKEATEELRDKLAEAERRMRSQKARIAELERDGKWRTYWAQLISELVEPSGLPTGLCQADILAGAARVLRDQKARIAELGDKLHVANNEFAKVVAERDANAKATGDAKRLLVACMDAGYRFLGEQNEFLANALQTAINAGEAWMGQELSPPRFRVDQAARELEELRKLWPIKRSHENDCTCWKCEDFVVLIADGETAPRPAKPEVTCRDCGKAGPLGDHGCPADTVPLVESAEAKEKYGCWRVVVGFSGCNTVDWWCVGEESARTIADLLSKARVPARKDGK